MGHEGGSGGKEGVVRRCNVGEPSLYGNDRDNTGDTEAKRLKIRSQMYENRMIELVC